MPDHIVRTIYFEQAGEDNTDQTLRLARERAENLGIRHIVVASTTGETGVRAAREFSGYNLTVVTHSTGFKAPNIQELTPENRELLEHLGAKILTHQHAFGGIGRAVRRKLGTYQLDEIIAFTLRTLGQGLKVACEITLMAADAGCIPTGQPVIAIGGTGRGADTAAVILSVNAQDFFDLRIMEIICKPRSW